MRLADQHTRISRSSDAAVNNEVADAAVKSAEETKGDLHRLLFKSDDVIISVVICAEGKPPCPLIVGIFNIGTDRLPVSCRQINIDGLPEIDVSASVVYSLGQGG